MKRITIAFCFAALLVSCNNETKDAADTKNDEAKVASAADQKSTEWIVVDSATAEKNWMAYMTPGEAHHMLSKSDGMWTGEMTMWMEEGAAPMKTTTTAENKMVMGGRYQVSTHKGDMMGMPFEGQSTVAFDNAKKTYTSTWIDNMGTGIMTMEGTWDSVAKVINFKGRMICPANGQDCEVKETYKIIDDNTHLMEMYGPDPKTGKIYKNMEIKFTRNK